MCTDYTDLNKHCPKDSYPLPSVEKLVDGASGNEILSLMDAYSGCNQIRMHPVDEEKTAFITPRENCCYKTMPFGLKNASATYQWLMNKVFHRQIGQIMEVYVDDMIAKEEGMGSHVGNLANVFDSMSRHNMRLNPEKCSFRINGGKLLGYMISARDIEANSDKYRAILEMKSPSNVKEVQRLTGRMAALSRFVPHSGHISIPFFKCLTKNATFKWSVKV